MKGWWTWGVNQRPFGRTGPDTRAGGVVIRAVNAVQSGSSRAEAAVCQSARAAGVSYSPGPGADVHGTHAERLAEPPRPPRLRRRRRQRTVSGNIPGEGSPLQRNSLEGAETRWGSLGGIPAGTGVEHGLTQRIKMRMKADPIAEAPRARRTSARPVFAPSRSTLVQGILYAEILGRPGGRRARR